MRVYHKAYIPSLIVMQEILDIQDLEGYNLDLAAPEPPEDPNLIISETIFQMLKPGDETVCIVLKADGYTEQSIAQILGKTETQIREIVSNVRKRLLEQIDKLA